MGRCAQDVRPFDGGEIESLVFVSVGVGSGSVLHAPRADLGA